MLTRSDPDLLLMSIRRDLVKLFDNVCAITAMSKSSTILRSSCERVLITVMISRNLKSRAESNLKTSVEHLGNINVSSLELRCFPTYLSIRIQSSQVLSTHAQYLTCITGRAAERCGATM